MDKDEAEEAVQKMFVRLWGNRKKLIVPDNPKAFLFRSVYNESIKLLRQKKTHQKYITNYFDQFKPELDENEDYINFLPYLNQAIEKLPEKCRQIFILNKIEGLTQKEIAEYLGISVKTVENQIAAAFSKLREELRPFLHLLPAGLAFFIF